MTTMTNEELQALCDAATPGPWAYRPQEYDDWGVVRAGVNGDGRALLICQARQPDTADLDQHRRDGADPYEADARLIAAAPTEIPRLLAEKKSDAETIAALTARVAELEGALENLIASVDNSVEHGEWRLSFANARVLHRARATLKARSA